MPRDKMNYSERGRLGAQKVNADRTPEQRQQIASHAHLAGAVNTVEKKYPELSPEQRARLRKVIDEYEATNDERQFDV